MEPTPKTVRSELAICLIVALVVVLFISGYEYGLVASLQKENSGLSSEVGSYTAAQSQSLKNLSAVVQAFNMHLSHLDERNYTAATEDYASNGIMYWYGVTQGFGGTYRGTSAISTTLRTFPGAATEINYTIRSENASLLPNGTASLGASLSFSGHSNMMGDFEGNLSASYSYVYRAGDWLILRESSDYLAFIVQYAQEG